MGCLCVLVSGRSRCVVLVLTEDGNVIRVREYVCLGVLKWVCRS